MTQIVEESSQVNEEVSVKTIIKQSNKLTKQQKTLV